MRPSLQRNRGGTRHDHADPCRVAPLPNDQFALRGRQSCGQLRQKLRGSRPERIRMQDQASRSKPIVDMFEQRGVVLGVVADIRQQHQIEPPSRDLPCPVQLLLQMLLTRELERVPRSERESIRGLVCECDLATEQRGHTSWHPKPTPEVEHLHSREWQPQLWLPKVCLGCHGRPRLGATRRVSKTRSDPTEMTRHRGRSRPDLNPIRWLAAPKPFCGPIAAANPVPGVRNNQGQAAAADLHDALAQDEPTEDRVICSFGNAGHRG